MQTFLPYSDMSKSARVLDRQRLGKQRVECMQIMKALTTGSTSWINHPCTKMWAGHGGYLLWYTHAVCNVWLGKGYKDTCFDKTKQLFADSITLSDEVFALPEWFMDEDFHNRHKSMLLQKDYEYYKQFDWDVPLNLIYKWWCPDKQAWYELN
jgi:hypothetical protein